MYMAQQLPGSNTFERGAGQVNSKSYASTSLSGGKKYYYRIRAYNAHGSSAYTAVVNSTPPTR